MSTQRRWPAARALPAPDLTDFMNDSFFGAVKKDKVGYNLTGAGTGARKEEGGGRSKTSKLTQEWLDEARRMVASSPDRRSSPVRRVGSPRFAAAREAAKEGPRLIEKRDPYSRSARRNRVAECVSDEILSRTARHGRNSSESFPPESPTAASASDHRLSSDDSSDSGDLAPRLQSRPLSRRKSRFHDDADPEPAVPPRRSFRRPSPARPSPASPSDNQRFLLSPPRNLVESANRRSISSNTCSQEKLTRGANPETEEEVNPRRPASVSPHASQPSSPVVDDDVQKINSFLRRQRDAIERISGGAAGKARIVLSGSSTSTTSSMIAAICYAWLLENTEGDGGGVIVPVMNMKRAKMCKHKQAAWIFHHLGVDATALLFADEVDLESLLMSRQLNILVIGQDILRTKGTVGSECTILTDNYCENAYDLLQTPNLKKLVLAGILLDTRNLDTATKFCTNRDAEAVQLLLVGSPPSYRDELFEQLMQDHRDNLFLEAMTQSYGKTSGEESGGNLSQEDRRATRKTASISSQEVKRPSSESGGNLSQEDRRATRKTASISSQEVKRPSSVHKKRTSVNLASAPTPASAPVPVRLPDPPLAPAPVRVPVPVRLPDPPGRGAGAVKPKPAQEKAVETLSRAKNKNKFSLVKLFNLGFGSK